VAAAVSFNRVRPDLVGAILEGDGILGATPESWSRKAGADFAIRSRLELAEAQARGERVGTAATRLRSIGDDMGRLRAHDMVRNAFTRSASSVASEWGRRNADVLGGLQWAATLDTRTCPLCGGLDGRRWPAGAAHPVPPAHNRCRCVLVPWLKSWRELGIDADDIDAGTRASMNGQVPRNLTWDQWLRSQPESVQREALGPGRWTWWVSQGRPPAGVFSVRGRVLTLEELLEGP
jgi:SPP1 gp7 family putative phage head morphogenesis protein